MSGMRMVLVAAAMMAGALARGAAQVPGQEMDAKKRAAVEQKFGGRVSPVPNGRHVLFLDRESGAEKLVREFLAQELAPLHIAAEYESVPKDGHDALAAARAKCGAQAPAVVVVEDDAAAARLSVYPEEAIAGVNVRRLKSGDAAAFGARLHKELWRALAFALGGYASPQPGGCALDPVFTTGQLDAAPASLSGMRKAAIVKTLPMVGLQDLRPKPYPIAVKEGWAPAPTNDAQRAVWERARRGK